MLLFVGRADTIRHTTYVRCSAQSPFPFPIKSKLACQSKVTDLDFIPPPQEQVAELQVTMDDLAAVHILHSLKLPAHRSQYLNVLFEL